MSRFILLVLVAPLVGCDVLPTAPSLSANRSAPGNCYVQFRTDSVVDVRATHSKPGGFKVYMSTHTVCPSSPRVK